jgi:hypothetical protein
MPLQLRAPPSVRVVYSTYQGNDHPDLRLISLRGTTFVNELWPGPCLG